MSVNLIPALPPPCTITVNNSKVLLVEKYSLWNREPALTTLVERRSDGRFFSYVDNRQPAKLVGTLEEVMYGLHPKVQQQYIELFGLTNPTEADVRKIGFDHYQIQTLS
jgi:hypothetical protein